MASLLTNFQYNQLQKLHNQEFQDLRKSSEARVLASYLNQAEDFLNEISSIPRSKFNKQELEQTFTYLDVRIDEYNQEIFPLFQKVQYDMADLAYTQTGDYHIAHGEVVNIDGINDLKSRAVNAIQEPIPGSSFKLSSAIWEEDKKDAIYQWVFDQIGAGQDYGDIVDQLAGYLTDNQQGSAYFKAYRVVDTEVIRSYVYSDYASVIDYNRYAGNKLVMVRKLSPMHKIPDICDSLEGIYVPEVGFPAVPSHPFCMCIVSKKFLKDVDPNDIRTDLKHLDGYVDGFDYKDAPMLFPNSFNITPGMRGGGNPLNRSWEIDSGTMVLSNGQVDFVQKLKDLGVYEADTLDAPVKDASGKVIRNANRFDQMMNNITQKLPREQQKDALIALQAILDPNDPYAMNAVKGAIDTFLKFV